MFTKEKKKYDVIALGRIAIDINPIQKNCSLIDNNQFVKYVGGSPANIAVGLSRLEKKVGFLGTVSNDRLGEYVIDYFKKEKIDTSRIAIAKNGEKLGLAFTEILSPTESSILMYRDNAADLALSVEDIVEEYIKESKSILISGTALCASPSREATLKALELAKKNKVTVIFDIDYRPYTWKSIDEVSIYYSLVGKQSDIILGSREEFDLMERFLTDSKSNDLETAKIFHGYGAKLIIIKHGKEGSCAYSNNGENFTVKTYPAIKLKSFGGGDGYASSLISGLLEELSLQEALARGSASASLLVAAESCSEAMPRLTQLKDFMASSNLTINDIVSKI